MLKLIDVDEPIRLRDYGAYAHLAPLVQKLRSEAELMAPVLEGRTVWMVNSTELGGGVAEMLPKMTSLLCELGVETRWAVMGTERSEYFGLTKRIHNMIHGVPQPPLTDDDRHLFDSVSRDVADDLKEHVEKDDVLVIHDPQPLGAGALLARESGAKSVWRCHIGLDERLDSTRAVWRFLEPYTSAYDLSVFSAPEYIPDYLAGRSTVIHPGIDPLSHKNRDLYPHKLTGILCNSILAVEHSPVLTPPFAHSAKRLHPDGKWGDPREPEEIGLLYRPIVLQVSRWDRLKGFAPLLEAFVELKTGDFRTAADERHRRRLDLVRLVLAGPDPEFIADDPEAKEVLEELSAIYAQLDVSMKHEIVLLNVPMFSRKESALMVNALQRCATVVVQNSIREGFGLTIAEAMWKRAPVLASSSCGARQQLVDRLEGRLVENPSDPQYIARVLNEMLSEPYRRELWSRNAQRRVHNEFLVFTQLWNWLRALCRVAAD